MLVKVRNRVTGNIMVMDAPDGCDSEESALRRGKFKATKFPDGWKRCVHFGEWIPVSEEKSTEDESASPRFIGN